MKTRLTILSLLASGALALPSGALADSPISHLPVKAAPSPADYFPIIDKAMHDANPNGQNSFQVPISAIGSGGSSLPDMTGQTGKFLTNDGTIASWATLAGGGDALIANPLSQFASTTSAQLAGVLSNETGTGVFVLNNSPSFSIQLTTPKVVYTGSVFDLAGAGSPEGAITASVGSLYRRTDGGVDTTLYAKETGSGNTGWVAVISGSGLPSQTGNNGKYLTTDGTTASWATLAGGGDALTTNPLSQFAATTSAQLRGVLGDETGIGAAVFANQPVFSVNITAPKVIFTGNVFESSGTGSPEGILTAAVGSTYRRTDGGVDATFYRKETGTGNTGWVASVSSFSPASEQTAGDAIATWTDGKTTFRRTAALTAGRNLTLPAAAGYAAGQTILYYDNATSSTSAFATAFLPGGSDTVNGGSGSYSPFLGGGTVQFATDGVSAWTAIYQRSSAILSLQDGTDPTKQASFNLGSVTTGNTRVMTFPDKNFTPPDLGSANVFTGGLNTFSQIGGSGAAPSIAAGAGMGTSPTSISVTGDSVTGTIAFTTGTSPTGSATIATLTFATAFAAAPHVTVTPHNTGASSGVAKWWSSGETTTTFILTSATTGLQASTAYEMTYLIAK